MADRILDKHKKNKDLDVKKLFPELYIQYNMNNEEYDIENIDIH